LPKSVDNPQFKKVAERIGEWVHGLGIPIGVQPNHVWRHLFKSVARHVRMDREVEGIITGHRPKIRTPATIAATGGSRQCRRRSRDNRAFREIQSGGKEGSRLSATTKRRICGANFAFDVERLELAGHVFSLAKCILRTHGEQLRLAR
jgi:hypothetical protein